MSILDPENPTVWVVIVREGGVYDQVRVFGTEHAMHEAGYRLEDVETEDWPHMKHYIIECPVDL